MKRVLFLSLAVLFIALLGLTGCKNDTTPDVFATEFTFINNSSQIVSVRTVIGNGNTNTDTSWSPSSFQLSTGQTRVVGNRQVRTVIYYGYSPGSNLVGTDLAFSGTGTIVFINSD